MGLAFDVGLGLFVQPRNSYWSRVGWFPFWGADNGAFSKFGFNARLFRRLIRCPNLRRHRKTCCFVAAPDRLRLLSSGEVVGDARATLDQFVPWSHEIRAAGFPVALVAQDGLEKLLASVAWDHLDVLFIGGSTAWKTSVAALTCVRAAQSLKKRTHMGRVNSYRRFCIAESWGMDTVDGTFLAFGAKKNLPRLLSWISHERRRSSDVVPEISLVTERPKRFPPKGKT